MATLRVFSGGAPQEIFKQLTPQFERQSGHNVEYVYAVMSALREKVASGEQADVLVMPTNILDGYEKDGVVRRQGRAVLGLVGINAVVRAGAPKPDLSTPDKVKQAILNSRAIVHATPGETPSGTHMGKLIETFGIAEAMKGKIVHRSALARGCRAGGERGGRDRLLSKERGARSAPGPCRPAAAGDPTHHHLRRGGDHKKCRPRRRRRLHRLHDRESGSRRLDRRRLRSAVLGPLDAVEAAEAADQRIGPDRQHEQHDQHGIHARHVERAVCLHDQKADALVRQPRFGE